MNFYRFGGATTRFISNYVSKIIGFKNILREQGVFSNEQRFLMKDGNTLVIKIYITNNGLSDKSSTGDSDGGLFHRKD